MLTPVLCAPSSQGATLVCEVHDCSAAYHQRCAASTSWDLERHDEGKRFVCPRHRTSRILSRLVPVVPAQHARKRPYTGKRAGR